MLGELPFLQNKENIFYSEKHSGGYSRTKMSVPTETSIPSTPDSKSVPQNTVENVKLPPGSKVVLPVEKVSPAVKKERTEAQKEAFKKMRMARDESNKRRQFSRQEALDKIDEMKEEERKAEEEETQRKAKELAEATGATVIVQKKRGRKPGEKIPYGGKPNPNLNIDAPSPPISAVYNMPIEKQAHYKAPSGSEPSVKAPSGSEPSVKAPSGSEPSVKAPKPQPVQQPIPTPQPVQPVYENPYLEMIRRKKR
jgi:hypothetical protein